LNLLFSTTKCLHLSPTNYKLLVYTVIYPATTIYPLVTVIPQQLQYPHCMRLFRILPIHWYTPHHRHPRDYLVCTTPPPSSQLVSMHHIPTISPVRWLLVRPRRYIIINILVLVRPLPVTRARHTVLPLPRYTAIALIP